MARGDLGEVTKLFDSEMRSGSSDAKELVEATKKVDVASGLSDGSTNEMAHVLADPDVAPIIRATNVHLADELGKEQPSSKEDLGVITVVAGGHFSQKPGMYSAVRIKGTKHTFSLNRIRRTTLFAPATDGFAYNFGQAITLPISDIQSPITTSKDVKKAASFAVEILMHDGTESGSKIIKSKEEGNKVDMNDETLIKAKCDVLITTAQQNGHRWNFKLTAATCPALKGDAQLLLTWQFIPQKMDTVSPIQFRRFAISGLQLPIPLSAITIEFEGTFFGMGIGKKEIKIDIFTVAKGMVAIVQKILPYITKGVKALGNFLVGLKAKAKVRFDFLCIFFRLFILFCSTHACFFVSHRSTHCFPFPAQVFWENFKQGAKALWNKFTRFIKPSGTLPSPSGPGCGWFYTVCTWKRKETIRRKKILQNFHRTFIRSLPRSRLVLPASQKKNDAEFQAQLATVKDLAMQPKYEVYALSARFRTRRALGKPSAAVATVDFSVVPSVMVNGELKVPLAICSQLCSMVPNCFGINYQHVKHAEEHWKGCFGVVDPAAAKHAGQFDAAAMLDSSAADGWLAIAREELASDATSRKSALTALTTSQQAAVSKFSTQAEPTGEKDDSKTVFRTYLADDILLTLHMTTKDPEALKEACFNLCASSSTSTKTCDAIHLVGQQCFVVATRPVTGKIYHSGGEFYLKK